MMAKLVVPRLAAQIIGTLGSPRRSHRLTGAIGDNSILTFDAASACAFHTELGGRVRWLRTTAEASLNGLSGRVQVAGLHQPQGFLHGSIHVAHGRFPFSVDPVRQGPLDRRAR